MLLGKGTPPGVEGGLIEDYLLQEDGRELCVGLSGEPQPEVLVGGREQGVELLLEARQPGHDQVHVLEAEPLAGQRAVGGRGAAVSGSRSGARTTTERR